MHLLQTVNITLPIPPKAHHPVLYKYFGDGLLPGMPGGLRELAMCVVENPENQDAFMQSVWDVIHNHIDGVEEPETDSVVLMFENAQWQHLDVLLLAFYQEYLASMRELFGTERWELEEVLDMVSGTGVVVKMARHDAIGPIPQHTHYRTYSV